MNLALILLKTETAHPLFDAVLFLPNYVVTIIITLIKYKHLT